jgi:hypothetical protein
MADQLDHQTMFTRAEAMLLRALPARAIREALGFIILNVVCCAL